MAINFPDSPTLNQIALVGSSYYIWNGTSWVGYSTSFTVNYNASSIVVQGNGSPLGATTTLNFSTNLTTTYDASGIATVTGSAGGGGSSQWVTTAAGIHTLSNVGIGTTNPITQLQVGRSGTQSGLGTFSASVGVSTTIDTFETSFLTAEYTVHIGYGTYIQAQKVLVMNNGSTAYSQEYAIMYEPSQIVSVGATVSGANVLLQVTPQTGVTGLTTYRFVRNSLI